MCWLSKRAQHAAPLFFESEYAIPFFTDLKCVEPENPPLFHTALGVAKKVGYTPPNSVP